MAQASQSYIVVQVRGLPQFAKVLDATEELLDLIENTYPSIAEAPQIESLHEAMRELDASIQE
jgi:hypothetical protein